MSTRHKKQIESILNKADIRINGDRQWDITIHNEAFYKCVLIKGSIGLGESYMDGWWDVRELDQFFNKLVSARLDKEIKINLHVILYALNTVLFNLQKKAKAFEIGEQHYDIGNDLYTSMLDKRMTYTCGYWKNAKTLDEAQEAKLDLICKKLKLKKGDRILDIGSGWGSFIKYAAEKYGVSCVGLTVSKEQKALADKLCKDLPVETRLDDYRDLSADDKFDHIVSIGMFEHVGYKNYKTYMQSVHRLLKDDGIFLLHTIGGYKTTKLNDPWIEKYIFPNSMLPSLKQISKASEGLFIMEDWHNFGSYYDTTLMHWLKNIDANWDSLKKNYDDRFYRMWKYYLMASSGTFRSRKNQLWQIVFTKHGIPGGYERVS